MVQLTTFMVAVAAVMMGVQCLDQASAKDIESQLVASKVIPQSESSESVHADGFLDDFLAHLPIPIVISSGIPPLPKITGSPDNSIQFNFPGFQISRVSGSVSNPGPQPSKGTGKRAVYDMDDHVSSSVVAAAVPSASASNAHSRSVKAVLRARGIRAAEFRSKVAEEYSASKSAAASSAHAAPSHLARRGASASVSASASDSQITQAAAIQSELAQAALDLSDLDKIAEAILGHGGAESLRKEFQSVSKAISHDLSKELSAHSTEVAQLKSLISKVSNYKVSKPTP